MKVYSYNFCSYVTEAVLIKVLNAQVSYTYGKSMDLKLWHIECLLIQTGVMSTVYFGPNDLILSRSNFDLGSRVHRSGIVQDRLHERYVFQHRSLFFYNGQSGQPLFIYL